MSAQEKKGTGKIVEVVVEGTIHLSNTPHHRVQSSLKVSTAVLHIKLSVSIMRSGDIMIISAKNPCEMIRQINQDKIWHKSANVLHKSVVAVQ